VRELCSQVAASGEQVPMTDVRRKRQPEGNRNRNRWIMKDQATLNDPRKLYPAPPFSNQPQGAPGLARTMEPVPDHGEESYRGSGKTALQPSGASLAQRWRISARTAISLVLLNQSSWRLCLSFSPLKRRASSMARSMASPAEGALPDHDA